MCLAALWDAPTGNFFPGQDWAYETQKDGSTQSCWELSVQQEADRCHKGLQNMYSYYTAQLARSPESSVPFGEAFHFRMSVMTEWYKRVVSGIMPHGALLAHTRLTGHQLVPYVGYSLPPEGLDWQQHGRDGVVAVKAILLNTGFYPQMVESVEGRRPPAVPSQAERNRATMTAGFARVEWDNLTIIRGAELWLQDEVMLQEYTWQVVEGGITASDVQCPVPCGELRPGEYQVTYYQQVKGHWFGQCTGARALAPSP